MSLYVAVPPFALIPTDDADGDTNCVWRFADDAAFAVLTVSVTVPLVDPAVAAATPGATAGPEPPPPHAARAVTEQKTRKAVSA